MLKQNETPVGFKIFVYNSGLTKIPCPMVNLKYALNTIQ